MHVGGMAGRGCQDNTYAVTLSQAVAVAVAVAVHLTTFGKYNDILVIDIDGLVWIVIAATFTKVVESCVYLRRRYYAIFGMLSGAEFEHSALCSVLRHPLSSVL